MIIKLSKNEFITIRNYSKNVDINIEEIVSSISSININVLKYTKILSHYNDICFMYGELIKMLVFLYHNTISDLKYQLYYNPKKLRYFLEIYKNYIKIIYDESPIKYKEYLDDILSYNVSYTTRISKIEADELILDIQNHIRNSQTIFDKILSESYKEAYMKYEMGTFNDN